MSRPKSARAHRKVLDAALELFAEHGMDATSVDAIAGRSGVSKATIYKHWADKNSLALEALVYLLGLDEKRPIFDSGDLRADLVAALNYQPAEPKPDLKKRIMPHLMAYAGRNREFGDQWRSRVIDPPRRQVMELLQRGIKQQQLMRGLNLEMSVAILLGPMLYRHIFQSHSAKRLPPDLAKRVVAGFWKEHQKP